MDAAVPDVGDIAGEQCPRVAPIGPVIVDYRVAGACSRDVYMVIERKLTRADQWPRHAIHRGTQPPSSCVGLELRPLPSPGVTRLQRYYEPLRHPSAPGLSLADVRLIIPDHALGLPVLRALSLCACRRHYPGAAAGRNPRSSHPAVSAFPDSAVGSAPIASGWSESPGGPCTHWKAPPCHGARRFRPFAGPRSSRRSRPKVVTQEGKLKSGTCQKATAI
jgi:hypothetical protein